MENEIQKVLEEFHSKFDQDDPLGRAVVLIESDEFGGISQRPIQVEIKQFLEQSLKQIAHKKESEMVFNVGLLRQWLNERTSKELITNEQILDFLKLMPIEYYKKQIAEKAIDGVLPEYRISKKGSVDIEEYEYSNGWNDCIRNIKNNKAKLYEK